MKIPSRGVEGWANEIIDSCTTSRMERVERGIGYRNLYYSGSEDGDPQTFRRMKSYIDGITAILYSPAELTFKVDYHGQVSPVERAKGAAASAHLNQRIRLGDVDTAMSDATQWACIKGKSLIKLLWSRDGFDPYLIQPECFGVLREDIPDLKRQEAFTHTTYLTRTRFAQMVLEFPKDEQAAILKKVGSRIRANRRADTPGENAVLKQIIVGGWQPLSAAANSTVGQGQNTVANPWGPTPTLAARVIEDLLELNETWVWDTERDDWTTLTLVEGALIYGKDQRRNAFADEFDPKDAKLKRPENPENPLAGKNPFIEFCYNRVDNYFWGSSAVEETAMIQRSLNARVDGINRMLRKEEDPPRLLTGSQSVNQNAYARLNKPGGYLSDANPNAKMQSLAEKIPADLWESFHELNGMFDIVGGNPPVTKGEGESGVRAQGHAETLLRVGSARQRDDALLIERSVAEVGGLALDILKAKSAETIVGWVKPGEGDDSLEVSALPEIPFLEPPVKGMKQVVFQFHHLSEQAKVTVDAHTSSPAFSQAERQLAFALAKAGAMNATRLIEATHPADETALVEDAERKEIAQAKLIAEHRQLAFQHKKKT